MSRIDLAGSLKDARARANADTPDVQRDLPKFARLERKDTRIRADQTAALTALAKTLMRRRRVRTERITENTLIRVAIDLLLAHADRLHGSSEHELRKSAIAAVPPWTSGLPGSATSDVPEPGTPELPHHRASDHADKSAW
ncbi:hypothetical protein [Microbacterium lacus]|uniref:Uncharacterized protein n=1 Tax=Microbacterium lacus TaxID=415217 RepID=A0ABN2FYZ3_9MICO